MILDSSPDGRRLVELLHGELFTLAENMPQTRNSFRAPDNRRNNTENPRLSHPNEKQQLLDKLKILVYKLRILIKRRE